MRKLRLQQRAACIELAHLYLAGLLDNTHVRREVGKCVWRGLVILRKVGLP